MRVMLPVMLLTGTIHILVIFVKLQLYTPNLSPNVKTTNILLFDLPGSNNDTTIKITKEVNLSPRFHRLKYLKKHPFVMTNRSKVEMMVDENNLLVLTETILDKPHSGIRLVSVRDKSTGRSCTFTNDKLDYERSDVIIIPGRALRRYARKPPSRINEDQRWVFYSSESFRYIKPSPYYRYAFNHTMTYHIHADINSAKFAFTPLQKAAPYYRIPPKKEDKMVAWMSSHCESYSKREEFVQILSQFITVDTFGSCGNNSCSRDEWCYPVLSQYKFYLAFENSMCKGYVTEKPWVGFLLGTVPLVAGAGSDTYRRVLPPHSYIDVEAFTSVEDVATYLKIVASDDALYRQYFAWRSHYDYGVVSKEDISGRACEYLHNTKDDGPHLVDFSKFSHDKRSVCQRPTRVIWNITSLV